MKQLLTTLAFLVSHFTISEAQETFQFTDLQGNPVADGSVITVKTLNSEGQMEKIGLPIRLNLNTDGEFTSGYTSYSLDGYDFIIEGSLAEDGAWKSFDGTLYQRIGGWQNLKDAGNGLCSGAGSGNKYEICMIRELFNAAAGASAEPKLMGDEFQAGVRFYTPDWGELSNMPNGPVTEENSKGYGHLLNVVTVASE